MTWFQVIRHGAKYELWVTKTSGKVQAIEFLKGKGDRVFKRMYAILLTTITEGKYEDEEIYRSIGDGIWEFKAHSVRLYSFNDEKRIVLTHAGKKPANVNADREKAISIREQYLRWKGSQE